jgi:hypothetical protein
MMSHLLRVTTGPVEWEPARTACDDHVDLTTKPFIPSSASRARQSSVRGRRADAGKDVVISRLEFFDRTPGFVAVTGTDRRSSRCTSI